MNYKVSSYTNLAIPSKDTNKSHSSMSSETNSIPCISTDTNINSKNCFAVNQTEKTTTKNPDGTYHHQVLSIIDEVETANKKGSPFIDKGQALILDPDLAPSIPRMM